VLTRVEGAIQLKLHSHPHFVNFLKRYLKNCHTSIIINASYEGICIEFERKNNTTFSVADNETIVQIMIQA